MAKRPTITTVASGYASQATIDANFEAVRDQFDNTLSLDGSTPNAMGADLDLNSNNIINGGTLNADSVVINGVNLTTEVANAAASATAAAASATAAEASSVSAASSSSSAGVSASAAATSETNAATSATNAATSETNASTSETNAASSATSASTSASNASTSETNAATSETNAATSETNAANSATAAAASEANVIAIQDAIDDTYLGAKASEPTVDNDGDPLTAGDWYFNTTSNQTFIYDGSSFQSISPDLVGDTTPQLGGNLDAQSFNITGVGNITLSGTVDGRDVATDGTKLDGIESGATADQSDSEIETAYNNQVATVSQVNAEAGTSTTVYRWTPERVKQAIDALSPSGGGTQEFDAGSASTPSITTTGDTNTGVFFPAADTVAVATGGAERMRIDNSGDITVGYTASSGEKVGINGFIGFAGSNGSDPAFRIDGSRTLLFKLGGRIGNRCPNHEGGSCF